MTGRILRSLIKYRYEALRYNDTFLSFDSRSPSCMESKAEEVVYCFWTGTNAMSDNRLKSIGILKSKLNVRFELITPDNLDSFIIEGFPLHKAFPYLSAVHKSDYLRCYFMHHYGGGYTDLKPARFSWASLFKKINSCDKWMLGYGEIGKKGTANVPGLLGKDLKKYWYVLLGNCSYICKPGSPFTSEWYAELHRRLDAYFDDLKNNPGNIMGDNEGYPIPWTNILGDIFHPLCLKYHGNFIYCDKIRPLLKHYR